MNDPPLRAGCLDRTIARGRSYHPKTTREDVVEGRYLHSCGKSGQGRINCELGVRLRWISAHKGWILLVGMRSLLKGEISVPVKSIVGRK